MSATTTPIDQPLAAQLRHLLTDVDSTNVPSGVLVWFGATDFPDGTSTDPVTLSLAQWTAVYLRLLGGASRHDLPAPPGAADGGAAQPGEPIPLVIASIAYERPTRAAISATLAAAEAGTTANLSDHLGENLESAHTFIAAAALDGQIFRSVPATRGRHFILGLAPEGLITNTGPITDVTVDDGNSVRSLEPGGSLEIEAPAGTAVHELTIAADTTQGRRFASCSIAISDDPVPPAPDETVPLGRHPAATGRLMVFRASNKDGERMHHPVLIAEGFPGGHSPQYLAEMVGQHGLLQRLRDAGRDVAIIGFDDGSQAMQHNASVVRAAIDHVSARTSDALTVSGWSMGGLITRYALAQMEAEGLDHRAAVYLSVDTPHGRGAYTTVCGQWFCKEFEQLSPAIAGAEAVLASPANEQFLGLRVHDDGVGPAAVRQSFLDDLAAVGWYPQRPVRLAVACGSGAGSALREPPSDPMMVWSTNGLGDIVLRHLANDAEVTIGSGTTMGAIDASPTPITFHSDVCWEVAPGAREAYFGLVAEPVRSLGVGDVSVSLEVGCSMPTVSALDLTIDPFAPVPPPGAVLSPFHDFAAADTNQHHLQLTADLADWIFDRIARHTGDTDS